MWIISKHRDDDFSIIDYLNNDFKWVCRAGAYPYRTKEEALVAVDQAFALKAISSKEVIYEQVDETFSQDVSIEFYKRAKALNLLANYSFAIKDAKEHNNNNQYESFVDDFCRAAVKYANTLGEDDGLPHLLTDRPDDEYDEEGYNLRELKENFDNFDDLEDPDDDDDDYLDADNEAISAAISSMFNDPDIFN